MGGGSVERGAGLEPAAWGLEGHCSAVELPPRGFLDAAAPPGLVALAAGFVDFAGLAAGLLRVFGWVAWLSGEPCGPAFGLLLAVLPLLLRGLDAMSPSSVLDAADLARQSIWPLLAAALRFVVDAPVQVVRAHEVGHRVA